MCDAIASQDVVVADASSVPDAIEEFEDTDGHFAPAATVAEDDVAKRRSARCTLFFIKPADDPGQLRHGIGSEVVIVGNGV